MAGGYVDVVRAGEVGAVCGAEESKSILQYLQYAVAKDIFATLRMLLEDGKIISCLRIRARFSSPIFSPRVISSETGVFFNSVRFIVV